MNENKKIAWLYVFLTAVISVVAVIFQYILRTDYIEAESGLYTQGSLPPGAYAVFVSVAVVLVLTSALVFRTDLLSKELKHGSVLVSITSLASAIAIVFASVMFFMDYQNKSAAQGSAGNVEKLRLVCSLIAVLAAVYYLTVAFSGKRKTRAASFLSFFPVIWTLLFLMSVYFDQSVAINSPVRTFRQLALIVFMLYQLFETRAMLGSSKPRLYFILSNLSVLLLSSSYIPELIGVFQGVEKLKVESMYSIYFGVSVLYVLARAIAFASSSNGIIIEAPVKKITKNKPDDELFEAEED